MTQLESIGLVERVGKTLLSPREHIRQSIHERRSLIEPILLASFISAVNGALTAVAFIGLAWSFLLAFQSFLPSFVPSLASWITPAIVAGSAISSVVSVLIAGIMVAAIMHLTARILEGHGFYTESLMIVFYSILPYGFVALPLMFSLIAPLPMLILAAGFLLVAFIWQVYILFEGIREVYGIDSGKTLIVLLSPLIFVILLAAFFSALFLLLFPFRLGGF